jgi:hypothetical protein
VAPACWSTEWMVGLNHMSLHVTIMRGLCMDHVTMVLQVLWACTLDLDTEEDFNRLFNCGLMGVLHGLCGIMDIARGAKWLTTRYGDSMALTFSVSACLWVLLLLARLGCAQGLRTRAGTGWVTDHIHRLL